MSDSGFHWVDYGVFVVTLLVSASIGVFFGMKKEQKTISGYLLGGKTMSLLPISMSLVTAYLSGITLVGIAAEVYLHGMSVLGTTIGLGLARWFAAHFVIPVFFKLQLFSSYEYMELRFGRGVRAVLSTLFTLYQLTYVPIVIHGSSLGLNQATGIDEIWIALIISSVCIFYTTIGGLKAVVYTDTIQGLVMLLSTAAIVVVGMIRAGGFQRVISAAWESERLLFDINPDPTVRLTIFSSTIFGIVQGFIIVAFSPEVTQRYSSLPTLQQAQKSAIYLFLGSAFLKIISILNGLITYASFQTCDPLSSGVVGKPDQILVYFVTNMSGNLKGLGGLFLAGVVCGGLSSMSASWNTMAGTIYYDLISPRIKVQLPETKALLLLAIGQGLSVGPVAGLFLLGLLFPWANNKGAICGGIASSVCMLWLSIANVIYKSSGHFKYPTRDLSVRGCLSNVTTKPFTIPSDDSDVPYIFRITVFYNVAIGMVLAIAVGLVVSWVTGFNRLEDVNPDLISPPVARIFLLKKTEEYVPVPLEPMQVELSSDQADYDDNADNNRMRLRSKDFKNLAETTDQPYLP